MSIRCSVKAIIIHDGRILLNSCKDTIFGEYYSLPGGGQNQYETMREAVVRECLEETGYSVNPVRLAAICETICLDEDFRKSRPDKAHKIFHIFVCELLSEQRAVPTEMDLTQLDSEWVDINTLSSIVLMPKIVGSSIVEMIGSAVPLFLGTEFVELYQA